MAYIWVREFTGGLDTRRMDEAASGGVLVKANNGHITRGGEFEQREAFVPTFDLPNGTIGMANSPTGGVVVFGHAAAPAGLPLGVSYQRLQHPDGATALVRILSTDLYAGAIYATAEFADGSVHHFYNGTRVTDWFDGRARATFEVVSGGNTPATAATATITITGGSVTGSEPGATPNRVVTIRADGVDIVGSPTDHTGDNATTAVALAAKINAYASAPNYTATVTGATLTIKASATGAAANGRVVVAEVQGDVTTSGASTMEGGSDAAISSMDNIRVDGVAAILSSVVWAGTPEATATAIATAINVHISVPDYTASAAGRFVSLATAEPGAAANGRAVTFTAVNGLVVNPTNLTMANGADSTNTYQPGGFVKTIGQKMYSTSGPNMHFSGIKEPTKWTTDTVGAGFIDMSSENSGSEELTSLARYQNYVAVFAAKIIQIWYTDPDPELSRQSQVLNNTGTSCPRSVTEFGDIDLFYLDESGLRSLRARDSSNAAATTDIGVPVDDLVTAKLDSLTENERRQVIGLIEPREGRFWLIMRNQIFVFSFFSGAKVSAWSTYDTTYIDGENTISFSVDEAMVYNRRVYLRSGNRIFVYGGTASGRQHDATVAEAWLPYMDADDPTRFKSFHGLDLAMRGLWSVSAAMDPVDQTAEDLIGIFSETTYSNGKNAFGDQATHISLRFRSQGDGPHRLGAAVVHYDGHKDDD